PGAWLRRRLPDPPARRADGIARHREPGARRRADPRRAGAARGDRRRLPRRRGARGGGDADREPARDGGGGASELLRDTARLIMRDEIVHGAVHVVAGRIADVEAVRAVASGAADLEGDYLIPGIVELHTDVLEKHAFPRPSARWPEVAAVVAHDGQLI